DRIERFLQDHDPVRVPECLRDLLPAAIEVCRAEHDRKLGILLQQARRRFDTGEPRPRAHIHEGERVRTVRSPCDAHTVERLLAVERRVELEGAVVPRNVSAEKLGMQHFEPRASRPAAENLVEIVVNRPVVVDHQDPPIPFKLRFPHRRHVAALHRILSSSRGRRLRSGRAERSVCPILLRFDDRGGSRDPARNAAVRDETVRMYGVRKIEYPRELLQHLNRCGEPEGASLRTTDRLSAVRGSWRTNEALAATQDLAELVSCCSRTACFPRHRLRPRVPPTRDSTGVCSRLAAREPAGKLTAVDEEVTELRHGLLYGDELRFDRTTKSRTSSAQNETRMPTQAARGAPGEKKRGSSYSSP